jgi:hypothetical protein
MRYVSRTLHAAPSCFTSELAIADRKNLAEFFSLDSETLSQNEAPASQFELDGDEVVVALSELFNGKCAFCETRTYINFHWFRPISDAMPLAKSEHAHLYYVWLRSDWNNLYASCSDCISSSRRQFPVVGGDRGRLPTLKELNAFAGRPVGEWPFDPTDRPRILDPCRTKNMVRHLAFFSDGSVLPRSAAGEATIEQYHLNRNALQDSRRRAFSDYLDLFDHALSTGDVETPFAFEKLEFGGAWYLLVRRAALFAGERLGRQLKLSPKALPNTVLNLSATGLGRDALYEGFSSSRPHLKRTLVRKPNSARQLVAIRIQNFKAVEHLVIPIITPPSRSTEMGLQIEATALVILGENAVGKSSVLEAAALTSLDAKSRANLGIPPSTFLLNPSLLGASDENLARDAVVSLKFSDGEETVLRILKDAYIEEKPGIMPPVFAYGAFRQYTARSSSRPSGGHVRSLFRSDVLLPNPEQWLLGLPDAEFAMVARALKHVFIVEGEFDVIRRDKINKRCLIVNSVGDGNIEVITPLMSVSSGFRSVVGMVCDILAGMLKLQNKNERQSFADLASLIMIDEIESHLHPRWKMQIISALRRTFPRSTIIATTHDPLCLRGLHPDEVIVLRQTMVENPGADELPVKVEKLEQLPNVENLTIEQLLTSDFFSMFSTDSVEVEERLARLADSLSRQTGGGVIDESDAALIAGLKREVIDVIPIGSTEIQQIIVEAVHQYLLQRRAASAKQLGELKQQTRQAIIDALGGL